MSIVFFSLWSIFAYPYNHIIQFSIPIVMLIMLRYNHLVEMSSEAGDPVNTVVSDWILVSLSVLFCIMSVVGIHFSP